MIDWKSFLALPALSAMTIIMGMDNVLAVAVITARLEPEHRARARLCGLGLAFLSRLVVLFLLIELLRGPQFAFTLLGHGLSFRSLLKFAGGAFLITKSLRQILDRALQPQSTAAPLAPLSFGWAVLQILFADQTQSMDSLVSVVGMAPTVAVMIAAILVELATILFFSGQVSRFIARFPSIQTVAVCALLLVGVVLLSEGLGKPIPRHYVYAMMAFSLAVEAINIRMGQRKTETSTSRGGRIALESASADRRLPAASAGGVRNQEEPSRASAGF